jgi:hypothetical protein
MKYNKKSWKNLFLKLNILIVSMVLLGNNDAWISIWFIYQSIPLFKRRIKIQTSSTGGASFSRYSPSKSPLNYYGIILHEYHSHLNKVGFPVILTAPDLTWPDLTWPDLTWPDLTWPDLRLYQVLSIYSGRLGRVGTCRICKII